MTQPVPSEPAPVEPPSVPSEAPPSEPLPSEPAPVVHPPIISDPLSGPPPPRADATAPRGRSGSASRHTVDPFDAGPVAPSRDGKALIYGGIAFSAVTIAVRVPVTTQLLRVGNPADAFLYGNLVNLAAVGAITTLVFGSVRRGGYLAHRDVVADGKRRRAAKPFVIAGWTLFGIGLATFAFSRLFAPLSCDLVNPCEFRALEATWYLSFVTVTAGAGLGSFGASYRDHARSYEQRRRVAVTPWLDRSHAGVGVSGRF